MVRARFLCLILLALTMACQAQSKEKLLNEVIAIYPGKKVPGTFTKHGNVTVKSISQNKTTFLRINQKDKNISSWAVRWFANHLPMQLGSLNASGKLFLKLEVRADQEQPISMQMDWRAKNQKRLGKPTTSKPVMLNAKTWTPILIPLPSVDSELNLYGFYFRMTQAGVYEVGKISLVSIGNLKLNKVRRDVFYKNDQCVITGQVSSEIKKVYITVSMIPEDGEHIALQKTVDVVDGKFKITLEKQQLKPAKLYQIACRENGNNDQSDAALQYVFAYPQITGKSLPPVKVQDGKLFASGKSLGFVGTNYTGFSLGNTLHAKFEQSVRDLYEMKSWGITVHRIPVDMAMIHVADGIFPDNPKWEEIYRKHKLDPRFFELYEYHIQLAGELGIYSIVDWHGGCGTRPYRYFLGGMPSDKAKGKHGTAISWLVENKTQRGKFDMTNLKHRKALYDSHRWLAKRFKGNPNILCFEVPFNEPHDRFAAVEVNWKKLVNDSSKIIKRQDPDRLTFTMGASWGHDTATASGTWNMPDWADGVANHYYLANGPIPLRPEATKTKHPWLVRDIDQSFHYGMASVYLPFSTQTFPMYNGENGEHGHKVFLPELDKTNYKEAARQMIEAGLAQSYGSGLSGYVLWTLRTNPNFQKYKDVYAKLFKKYAPIYNAGAVDWSQSDVLFIQNPAAVPIANGHNYAVVPIAQKSLDLHLGPIHYMTDDQFLHVGSARYTNGLEQVQEGSSNLQYKAVILDIRNCDQRVIRMVEKMKIPTLIVDDMAKLSTSELSHFLSHANVHVDTKTPSDLQIFVGSKHVLIFNHSSKNVSAKAFPNVPQDSAFKLSDEQNKIVFQGTTQQLKSQGIPVKIVTRTGLILNVD